MSTIIYPSPIFGPIKSRRLGISLGINLMPPDGKVCTFDCIYCECGYNSNYRPHLPMPTREEVKTALKGRLQMMKQEGLAPDVLTFAGNGEPTIHPQFPGVIEDTLSLRDRYFPNAKVSVLTNATRVIDPIIRNALMKVDNPIMKLDSVNEEYIRRVDRPTGHYSLSEIIEGLKAMKGHAIIQTMFLKGKSDEGEDVDNTTDEYVFPWIKVVKEIAPRHVMIYTIDRETPGEYLKKATPQELDHIAELLRAEEFEVSVSY